MYNWVTRRKIARTEGPNYPTRAAQTVDAVVAKWIPVTAALLACAVTPVRPKLDVRRYEWAPAFTWVRPVVDATVRTYLPAATSELQSYRAAARPPLDVRRYEWAPEPFDLVTRVDALVKTWSPAARAELANERIAARPKLDVRRYEWTSEETSWIAATQTAAASVAQTAPAWTNQAQQYRTSNGPALDVTRTASSPNLFGTPEDWAYWTPLQDHGGLTRDRARLDVRGYEWAAWVASSWVTESQQWPGILPSASLSYRTPVRVPLDVRTVDWASAFSWVTPVTDAAVAKFSGVYGSELSGYRTSDRARLDVRTYRWAPDEASWELFAVAPPASVAQRWPAILQNLGTEYATADRAKLDVRRFDWQPASGWSSRVVESELARWAPIFRAELLSARTSAAPVLDVRCYEWAPSAGWITTNLPTAAPEILDGRLYRTDQRPVLDVRAYDWQPAFTWHQGVVDAIVTPWAPVFLAQLSPRTPDRPRLEIHALTETSSQWLSPLITATIRLNLHVATVDTLMTDRTTRVIVVTRTSRSLNPDRSTEPV